VQCPPSGGPEEVRLTSASSPAEAGHDSDPQRISCA
jgi:hypothetical protein